MHSIESAVVGITTVHDHSDSRTAPARGRGEPLRIDGDELIAHDARRWSTEQVERMLGAGASRLDQQHRMPGGTQRAHAGILDRAFGALTDAPIVEAGAEHHDDLRMIAGRAGNAPAAGAFPYQTLGSELLEDFAHRAA